MQDSLMTPLQLPLLDVSQPLHPSVLSVLNSACRDWGFFHITNHGISKELYNKIYILCKEVFNQPLDIKLKLGPSASINTYTPHFIASPFFESLRVSGPDFYNSAKKSSNVLFQRANSEFCEVLQEYGNKMIDLSKKIISILLNCLEDGFEKKYHESEFIRCHGYLRINNYSAPGNFDTGEIEGLGKHTDMSCITILYQDEIGGLQVRSKRGEWVNLTPNEGTLVVNIGDLLQAWSNGRLRSSEHRVVLKHCVNRFSMAFFWCFEDEKVIKAPEDLVGKENSRMYPPFICQDYVKFRENSERGRFDIVGYTVDDFTLKSTSISKDFNSKRSASI
ncbi:gibberellin 20-oxidase-like protein [Dendrobium catenatum]|uniref:Gibberellin 3-beta-dioxygenase 4 n=1 Tax=Dendrobium catenatum TaxID=906689 RepID=A0A2I0WX52_9ASPA|nr:gibberellin 20-oxidase-like protein [Dendrobium catenatum]XP_028550533.1 gibberellin 20-oxidase-like protein [Dendrobium catenatum]PKU80231.1 Gibberellin 3-beta-dioxygenase 4 [Dendrobium catenatum]